MTCPTSEIGEHYAYRTPASACSSNPDPGAGDVFEALDLAR